MNKNQLAFGAIFALGIGVGVVASGAHSLPAAFCDEQAGTAHEMRYDGPNVYVWRVKAGEVVGLTHYDYQPMSGKVYVHEVSTVTKPPDPTKAAGGGPGK